MEKREGFGSRFGTLVVIAGSAVGLGNIWRFPYMVGSNGGAAFILIYLFFVAAVCVPIMISELLVGRRSRATASNAMRVLAPQSRSLHRISTLYVIVPTLVLSYYCVVGGMTVDYFLRSLGMAALSGTGMSVVWTLVFLCVTGAIVVLGVKNGIERFSKVMMPLLFIIVILIALRSMTLPQRPGADASAADGLRFLFRPDFSKVTARTFLSALGQAFFSLSVGAGVLMTYGSYIRPKENLCKMAGQIAFFDLLFAIIAGCAVIPAVFALKDSPLAVLSDNTDSALVFETLPAVFPQMPLGQVVGVFFFFALTLAALTSSISQYEVPVSYLVEEKGLSRRKASVIVFAVAAAIGTACAFRGQVMAFLDGLCANWLMPACGALVVFFVGWRMSRTELVDELSSSGVHRVSPRLASLLRFAVRYIAPVGILAVFLTQIFS